jgi:chromosome segregation ATPase
MSATAEALALVALLPDAAKYQQKLQELIDKTDAANAAVANLAAKEKVAVDKIAVAETVLASLNEQADASRSAQEAAEARLAARETGLAQRETTLQASKEQHDNQAKAALAALRQREDALAQQVARHASEHDERAGALLAERDRLSAHHLALRATIAEARKGLAAAS